MGPANLFAKLFKKEAPYKDYLALTLTPNSVFACIWSLEEENVEILKIGQKSFKDVGSLIHQAAIAIDTAGQHAQSDVAKTVFGLSNYWLEDGKPSESTFKILKNLAQDLELDPDAYVSLAAAVNHFLKIEEAITPSIVLVGIFEDFCEVHLIKNNKLIASQNLKGQIEVEKITKVIRELKEEVGELPPRIILFGQNSDRFADKLSKLDWQDLFAHEPKIEILEDEDLAKATAYAQAADILGYEPIALGAVASRSSLPTQKPPQKADAFGFVEGEDILFQKKEETSEPLHETPSPKQPEKREDYAVETDFYPKAPKRQDLAEEIVTAGWISKIFSVFQSRSTLKNLILALAVILLVILGASFVAANNLSSAEVNINVNAQNKQEDFKAEVVLIEPDNKKNQIIGQTVIAKASGSQKAVTTGSETIGEYSTGEVTVLNWTLESKTFKKGTVIITKSGTKFALDLDLEVASRSASTPGENNSKVKALDYGPSSNIDGGNEFSFQEYDELLYSARNDAAFTGGAEKKVTVVSQEDLNRLEKSQLEALTEKAKGELKSKVTDKKLHDPATVIKILKKEFDKNLDEEASLVNLDMEVEASAIVYNEQDLKTLLSQNITGRIPQNFQARPEDIEIQEVNIKTSTTSTTNPNSLSLSGKYLARLLPKIDEDDLKNKISGKSTKEARSIIKTIPEVSDVQINFSPNLPIISSLPRDKSKIEFNIEANQ